LTNKDLKTDLVLLLARTTKQNISCVHLIYAVFRSKVHSLLM